MALEAHRGEIWLVDLNPISGHEQTMSPRTPINLNQEQSLAITPRLLQAIEMLQMPRLELIQHIAQLMVENPVLEESYEELEDAEDKVAAADNEIPGEDIDHETGLPETEAATEADTPEIRVDKIDGEYRVFVSDYGRPLTLSPRYLSMIKARDSLSDEVRDYLKSHIQSAQWIIESVEHRRKTILRVTEAIFEEQKDFLDRGSAYLKPLTRRDIAEKLGIHESTVIRATSGKYVQTSRGVFPLEYFFSSGVSTASESVKEMIKEMIDKEDPQNPLKDQDIVDRLNQQGFEIKLRTVNKYRNSLNIPNSSIRMASSESVKEMIKEGKQLVLVVSADPFNMSLADMVVVVPLTTRKRGIPLHVEVKPPEAGLKKTSYVMCENIRSISKERLNDRCGVVSDQTMRQVEKRLQLLFEI